MAEKVCIVMPAFNEGRSVRSVIGRVRTNMPKADIVVINDGSTDNTREEAEAAGALVLSLPFNLGIGGAVQTGLKYAQRGDYDIAVEVDSDGQHDPTYISRLVDMVAAGEADMAIGSRFLESTAYQSSWLRLVGIKTFSYLIWLV